MSFLILDRKQGRTVYSQIAKILEKKYIQNGRPGDRLPSENNLAKDFGVNRHTIRRAVDELVSAGILVRLHGVGIFISEKHLDYKLKSKTRFTATLQEMGMTTDSEVIRKNVIEAPEKLAESLKLKNDKEILWIDTLRYADGRPLCVISHFIPLIPFGDSLKGYKSGSLHQVLIEKFGALVRIESLVTADVVIEEDAKLLGISKNEPILRVKSLNVLEKDNTPVEYAVTRFRGDQVQLRIDLNNKS